ncbi:MAG: hypothetical protein ACTSVV_16720 [Promethearchaeota archaeon]
MFSKMRASIPSRKKIKLELQAKIVKRVTKIKSEFIKDVLKEDYLIK